VVHDDEEREPRYFDTNPVVARFACGSPRSGGLDIFTSKVLSHSLTFLSHSLTFLSHSLTPNHTIFLRWNHLFQMCGQIIMESKFRFPIEHQEHVHTLESHVVLDLEIKILSEDPTVAPSSKPVHLSLVPSDKISAFTANLLSEMSPLFTSDVAHLRETQDIIRQWDQDANDDELDTTEKEWTEFKTESSFLEKYGYMEWDMLKSLNQSSVFLQFTTCLQLTSPLMSLAIPLLILLIPFVILKFQGIPIEFGTYVELLKIVAKDMWIGKLLSLSCSNCIKPQEIMYMMVMCLFYGYTFYQNILSACRQYRNVQQIHEHLNHLHKNISYWITQMETFSELHSKKSTYQSFCKTTVDPIARLKSFQTVLAPFYGRETTLLNEKETTGLNLRDKWGFFKTIGNKLEIYYMLFHNVELKNSIEYAMKFSGYMKILSQLHERTSAADGSLQFCAFADSDSDSEPTVILDQIYPASVVTSESVPNSVSLNKNIILTGPNASGKTTLLKTTALNVLFSQQWGLGFYKEGAAGRQTQINPYTHIHSYLNIPDTSGRDSLFQGESRRCKEMLDKITGNSSRHFCILDELYSGTNYDDATQSGLAFLKYLAQQNHVDVLLTTHYTKLCSLEKSQSEQSVATTKKFCNYRMQSTENSDHEITYTYKMVRGISHIKGAYSVLKELNYPEEILKDVLHESEETK
jgi:hypothetical protein